MSPASETRPNPDTKPSAPLSPEQRAWVVATRQALAAQAHGNWIQAETSARKALEQARALGGEDLLASLNLLGTILQGLGRAGEALVLYKEVLTRAETGRERVVALANRGAAERETGGIVAGEEALSEALVLARGEYPEELPGVLDKLARLFQETGRIEEAIEAFAERVRRTEGEPPSDDHLDGLFHLATAEADASRHEDAASHFEELASKLAARGGTRSLGRAQALTGLARARQALGRHADAVVAAREAFDVRSAMLGPDHPELLPSRHNLAHVLLAAGKARDAEPHARAVVEATASLPGGDGRRVAALEVLVAVLEKTGRLREAGQFKKLLSKS